MSTINPYHFEDWINDEERERYEMIMRAIHRGDALASELEWIDQIKEEAWERHQEENSSWTP